MGARMSLGVSGWCRGSTCPGLCPQCLYCVLNACTSPHCAVLHYRYDTLVAGGGDGTLNELVVALIKHDAPRHISVAQLPMGTANDLASATGISLVRATAALWRPDVCTSPCVEAACRFMT
jgi:hypothetical protein